MASKAERLLHVAADASAAINGVVVGTGIVTKDPVLLTIGVGSGLLGCGVMLLKKSFEKKLEDIDYQVNDHDHS